MSGGVWGAYKRSGLVRDGARCLMASAVVEWRRKAFKGASAFAERAGRGCQAEARVWAVRLRPLRHRQLAAIVEQCQCLSLSEGELACVRCPSIGHASMFEGDRLDWRWRDLPANNFQMRFVVLATVRIRRHQRSILELHRWAEAASLGFADRGSSVQHDSIFGKIELETVLGL